MESRGPFSLYQARLFADKYKDASSEKQLGQSFWRDFLTSVCGVSDLLAAGIEFEYPIRMASTQAIGFADVFWPNVLLVEHKSAGFDLDKAELQARDYLTSLDPTKRPPVFIVCNFSTFRLVEVFAGTSLEFPIQELPEHLQRFEAILGGYTKGVSHLEVSADSKAASLMAELFVEIERAGFEGHAVSVFLVRILFLLFGDDTNLWMRGEKGLFETLVESSPTDGAGLGGLIQELFQVLNTPREERPKSLHPKLANFPLVNGGLFREPLPVFSFTPEMRKALYNACKYDWSQISPAIFGAMFQTVKDKAARREMGEHFTSEANIMKVISPLFLNDFHERLTKSWDSPTALRRFHKELPSYNFLDPAAGCGNFLLVSYKRLRELELKLVARLQELEGKQAFVGLDGSWGVNIRLSQFHGIEYEEWSSQIATVAMFLAEHQANLAQEEILGSAPSLLPLSDTAQITHANALQVNWADICPMNERTIIFGNPPFGGSTWQTKEQKEDSERLWAGTKASGVLDYVSNWFLVASRHMKDSGATAGFVATNSITLGQQPAIIWSQLEPLGIGIDFAHRSFNWENGAPGQAGVHCIIMGLSAKSKPTKRQLWIYRNPKGSPELTLANNINAYLLDADNVLITSRSKPLSSSTEIMENGSKPTDEGLLSNISPEEAAEIRKTDAIATKYLRRIWGGRELIHNEERYALWLIGADPADIRNSPVLSKRVAEVRRFRENSTKKITQRDANRPTEFQELRQPRGKYLAVPVISSELRDYVPIAILDDEIINNKISYILGDSLLTFGMISSRPFNVWNKAVSGRTRNDTVISNNITYNNFPFPQPTDAQRQEIENASKEVLTARALYPSNSLADLYDTNSMPVELRKAHKNLDSAVLAAYGLKEDATDERVLELIFSAYTQATADLFTSEPKVKKSKAATGK
jgi:hypothetical protein